MKWFDASVEGFEPEFRQFLRRRAGGAPPHVAAGAAEIVEDVRRRGGAAVAELTMRLDRLAIDAQTLQNPTIDLNALARDCAHDVRRAIAFAAKRIADYHERQTPSDFAFDDGNGMSLGWRWSAIDSVGLYVPGGRASYPSSLLMNAIPARVAGVKRLVVTAPAPVGEFSPAVAYAALEVGIREFYPIGGAQAVAALAYGAGVLQPVDKIVGPGNAWVAAAKRLVFGDVGIDTIAGPSEITVVADSLNNPDWIAADLLSQCEHDPFAQAILVCDDREFAQKVILAVEAHLQRLTTSEVAGRSWRENGAIVIAPLAQAPRIVNTIAPEHVEIATENPAKIADEVVHAGAIFLGRWAPEALGDYVTGSNHVLPTSGAARFASGLSTFDFLKRTSVQRIDESGFKHLSEAARVLADAEGLHAHSLSISIRSGSAS